MDTKQYVCLEVVKGDHKFTFSMPLGCTWGNAIDASFEVLTHVNQLAQNIIEQSKPEPVSNSDQTITKSKEL